MDWQAVMYVGESIGIVDAVAMVMSAAVIIYLFKRVFER